MNDLATSYPLHQAKGLLSHDMSSYLQIQTIDDHQDMFQVNPFSYNLEGCTTDSLPILKLDNIYKAAACISPDTTNITRNVDSNHNKMKSVMRRDVERRRRQEMTTLYALLRSLLPLEYIKGKRSISDHMNQAAIYIKHLKKKIQEMRDRRDGLKRMYNISDPSVIPISSSQPDFVTVRPCFCGFEIVINTSYSDGLLPLSSVFQALLANGLTVSSCVSTTVNERSLHTIQVEVSDLRGIDAMELQQKLMDLIEY